MRKSLFLVLSLFSFAQAQQLVFNLEPIEVPQSSISYPKGAEERLSSDVDTVEFITQDGITSVSPFPRQLYSQQIAEKVLQGYRYMGRDGHSQYITVGEDSPWLKMGEYDAQPRELLKDWALQSDGQHFFLANSTSHQAVNPLQPKRITSNNQPWCFYLVNNYNDGGDMRYDWLAIRMDKVSGQCS